MKHLKVPILIAFAVMILAWLIYFAMNFAQTMYPNAEYYKTDFTYSELVAQVKAFKQNVIKYNPPDSLGYIDQKDDYDSYIFHIYYAENDEILFCVVKNNQVKSSILFVSIAKAGKLSYWEDINRDFDDDANEYQKKLFKERIVDPILKNKD